MFSLFFLKKIDVSHIIPHGELDLDEKDVLHHLLAEFVHVLTIQNLFKDS